jgi:hypothetical protein
MGVIRPECPVPPRHFGLLNSPVMPLTMESTGAIDRVCELLEFGIKAHSTGDFLSFGAEVDAFEADLGQYSGEGEVWL